MRNLICIFITVLITCPAFAQVPYGDNPAAGKYITVRGVKHYYEVYGSGRPMLLIHGNSTAIVGWRAQIEYFSQTNKVYAIDCRGRGKSELGNDSLTYAGMAEDMAAFLDLLKLDSVDVIGKSDGAIVALIMAMEHPQRLRRVVAFAANLWPDSTALYPETVNNINRERRTADSMLKAGNNTKNWKLEVFKQRLMEFQPHITREQLSKIKLPVLVMSCDRDVIKEEHTLFIYQSIPNASLCFINGEQHALPKKNPALFNQAVTKFLSSPVTDRSYRFK